MQSILPKHKTRPTGFTLVEMLTAVAITSIMLFLINTLYFQTQNAVSAGIATSNLIQKVRAASDELERMSQKMVGPQAVPAAGGPDEDGFLVITSKVYNNITIAGNRVGNLSDNLHSDTLTFIAQTDIGWQPITPRNVETFENSTTAPYVKVSLGHVVHTDDNGVASGNLGTGANSVGSDWTLGLQYLFLDENTADGSGTPANIYAAGARHDSSVVGYTTDLNAAITAPQLFHALTDVAHVSFKNATSTAGAVAPGPQRLLVGPETYAILQPDPAFPFGGTQYQDAALGLSYAFQRMTFNPLPTGDTYWASQIAQMHTGFLNNCSEVVIDFAADADNSGAVDVDANGIIWYGQHNMPTWTGYTYTPTHTVPAGAANNADVAFVWRHDYPQNWPYLIRIRYRINDRRGVLEHQQNNTEFPWKGVAPGDTRLSPGKWYEQIIRVNRN